MQTIKVTMLLCFQIWLNILCLSLWSWVYDCPTQTCVLPPASPLAFTKSCCCRETGVWARDSSFVIHGLEATIVLATISWQQQKHLPSVPYEGSSQFLCGCRTRLIDTLTVESPAQRFGSQTHRNPLWIQRHQDSQLFSNVLICCSGGYSTPSSSD